MKWLLNFSFRTKIVIITASLILILAVSIFALIRVKIAPTFKEEMVQRGVAVARDLASGSVDAVLTQDYLALHQLSQDVVESNEDVWYAYVRDASGKVVAHSFEGGFPTDLLALSPPAPHQRYRIELLDTEEGHIRDIAVPIYGGQAGMAYIGISEEHFSSVMAGTQRWILGLAGSVLLVGIGMAYFLARLLTRPVGELVELTQAVADGDFQGRASVKGRDEIGRLGAAFNTMTDRLARSRGQLLALQQAISAVNSTHPQNEVLQAIVGSVTRGLGYSQAAVALMDRNDECPQQVLAAAQQPGLPALDFSIVKEEDIAAVCRSGRAMVITEAVRQTLAYLPIKTRDRVLGVLVVSRNKEEGPITQEDLEALSTFADQAAISIEKAHLWEAAQHKQELRGELLSRVISAQEEERKRVARELHDETSQHLTTLLLGLKLIESSSDLEEVRVRAADLTAVSQRAYDEVRHLASQLRPSVLDDLGLLPALRAYVEEYTARLGLDVDFRVEGAAVRLPPEMETVLYRVIQEALINTAKHAQASQARVVLRYQQSAVLAEVEDDGEGFDMDQRLGPPGKGLGLHGIQERISLLGGKFELASRPGAGTRLFIEIPIAEGGGADE